MNSCSSLIHFYGQHLEEMKENLPFRLQKSTGRRIRQTTNNKQKIGYKRKSGQVYVFQRPEADRGLRPGFEYAKEENFKPRTEWTPK